MKKNLSAVFILLSIVLAGTACAFKSAPSVSASACAALSENAAEETAGASDVSLSVDCKSAYLMDYDSETCVYEKDENLRLPIASMCKIMTLILCFDALDDGNISLGDSVPVSEHASSMGGSQVFLESGAEYNAGELIKSIAVCSANDSCVAMAEYICGSDGVFVDRMNERARSFGANDTLFANCTGLPKETQYSTAHDVALMLKELLSHKEYYNFSRVWTEKFVHPKDRYTEMTNTNKLIRFYSGCDGGKTGFTNQAGFCLAATAKRGDMRLISVAIGAETSEKRFSSVKNMFDYAFSAYTRKIVVSGGEELKDPVPVSGGKVDCIKAAAERGGYVFALRSGGDEKIRTEYIIDEDIKAPVKKGDKVGEIIIFKNGVEYDRINIVSLEDSPRAGLSDYVKKIASAWNF